MDFWKNKKPPAWIWGMLAGILFLGMGIVQGQFAVIWVLCRRSWTSPKGHSHPQIKRPSRLPARKKNPSMAKGTWKPFWCLDKMEAGRVKFESELSTIDLSARSSAQMGIDMKIISTVLGAVIIFLLYYGAVGSLDGKLGTNNQ